MGCEPGLGATHLSLALANYLASGLGIHTALAELGDRNSLSQLSVMGVTGSFRLKGVEYFPNTAANQIGQILCRDFGYIIFDLGSDSPHARAELLRCNGKIIIGSLSPWRKNVYYDYIDKIGAMMGNTEDCTFLSLFGDRVENKNCRRICKVQIKSIPFMANPFLTKGEEATFLHALI